MSDGGERLMGMDILSILTKKYDDLISKTKIKGWSKEDLTSFLKNNIDSHKNIVANLSVMSDREMQTWYQNRVAPAMMKSADKAKTAFNDYRAKLSSKAQAEERKRPLGSLLKANETYAKLLTEILKKVDDLVEEKFIDVHQVKLSQLSILGILRQSDKVLNFSAYLFTFMIRLGAGNEGSLPKYRSAYLTSNVTTIASVVSDLIEKKGIYLFLQNVDAMRRQQGDRILGAGWSQGGLLDEMINGNNPAVTWTLATLALAGTIYFLVRHGPTYWDDWMLSRHNKNKEMKAWIENHVALLRMEAQELDPSDPKYAKMMSIIEAYDQKIAEYDEKIRAFEDEE